MWDYKLRKYHHKMTQTNDQTKLDRYAKKIIYYQIGAKPELMAPRRLSDEDAKYLDGTYLDEIAKQ